MPVKPLSCLLFLAVVTVSCSSGKTSSPAAAPTSRPPAATGCGPKATTAPGATAAGDAAVSGDIPDTQAYVTYPAADGYRIDVPEGWGRSQSGTTVAFTDKFNAIRVEVVPAVVAPTVAEATAREVGALAVVAPCFQAGQVSQVTRKAGSAILITFKADSAQDPVTGKIVRLDVERYEFWRSGKEAVVTLSSPTGSDNVDPWKRVTDSFAWSA